MTALAITTSNGIKYTFAAETGLMGGVVYTVTAKFADGEEMLCLSHRNKARVARWFASAA